MMEFSKLQLLSAALVLLCVSSPVCYSHDVKAAASLTGSVDSDLEVPSGNKVQTFLLGLGTQTYNYNGSAWVLANATAVLYNFRGQPVGHHYFLNEVDSNGGQPTWESYDPVSRVTGRSIARVRQPDAVDWVLLKTTSASGHDDHETLFGSTTYIQRVYTQRGLPPPAGLIASEGNVYESPYVTMYCFWRAGGPS